MATATTKLCLADVVAREGGATRSHSVNPRNFRLLSEAKETIVSDTDRKNRRNPACTSQD